MFDLEDATVAALEAELFRRKHAVSGYAEAASAVLSEVIRARYDLKFAPFHSAHEGFAVALEEVDELKAHVWTNQKKRDYPAMRKEAMQCAAMFLAFMVECAMIEQEGTLKK